MTYSDAQIWTIIVLLGVGTFLIRFSFLGLIGSRKLPEWALRHLRYTPVAVLPGLVAPLVLFPAATDGNPDPARLASDQKVPLLHSFPENFSPPLPPYGLSLIVRLA